MFIVFTFINNLKNNDVIVNIFFVYIFKKSQYYDT